MTDSHPHSDLASPQAKAETRRIGVIGFQLRRSDEPAAPTVAASTQSESPPHVLRIEAEVRRFSRLALSAFSYLCSIQSLADNSSTVGMATLVAMAATLRDEQAKHEAAGRKALCSVRFDFEVFADGTDKPVAKSIEVNIYFARVIEQLIEYQENQKNTSDMLLSTSIQQVWNAFEQLIADSMRFKLYAHPASVRSEAKISYREVLSHPSIESLKNSVIESEIEQFGKMSSEAQIEEIDKTFSNSWLKALSSRTELVEIALRRHAIVHADGVASREYIERLKELDPTLSKQLTVGNKLQTDTKYVSRACNVVHAAGLIMYDLLWKKNNKDTSRHDRSESILIAEGLRAIRSGCHEAGELIFNYALENWKSDRNKLVAKINLAQCRRRNNNQGDWKSLVHQKEWKHCSAEFRVCAAAIREDMIDLEASLMAAKSDPELFNIGNLFDWPLFEWVRNHKEFDEVAARVYGDVPVSLRNPHALQALLVPQLTAELKLSSEFRKLLESESDPKS